MIRERYTILAEVVKEEIYLDRIMSSEEIMYSRMSRRKEFKLIDDHVGWFGQIYKGS